MRERPKIAVIVNPAAHKGGAAKRWPAIQAELVRRLGPVEPLLTQAPGHATHLARAALAQGARRFVAVGGDMRLELFDHLSGHGARYFADRFPGALAGRITTAANAVWTIENALARFERERSFESGS